MEGLTVISVEFSGVENKQSTGFTTQTVFSSISLNIEPSFFLTSPEYCCLNLEVSVFIAVSPIPSYF